MPDPEVLARFPLDTGDPAPAVAAVAQAHERFVETVRGLHAPGLAAPSVLPGWTRAHVATHVARNADALGRLLRWGRTGEPTPAYAAQDQRDRDIEDGVGRSPEETVADLERACEGFLREAREMPVDRWGETVRMGPGGKGYAMPAQRALWLRLKETEVHHADLGHGYGPADWPPSMVTRALEETAALWTDKRAGPAMTLVASDTGAARVFGGPDEGDPTALTITGPESALLAWIAGRTAGDGLSVAPAAPLPALPAWA